jgi:hypothetical protein
LELVGRGSRQPSVGTETLIENNPSFRWAEKRAEPLGVEEYWVC